MEQNSIFLGGKLHYLVFYESAHMSLNISPMILNNPQHGVPFLPGVTSLLQNLDTILFFQFFQFPISIRAILCSSIIDDTREIDIA